jgi:hypothetical protein
MALIISLNKFISITPNCQNLYGLVVITIVAQPVDINIHCFTAVRTLTPTMTRNKRPIRNLKHLVMPTRISAGGMMPKEIRYMRHGMMGKKK